MAFCSKCGNQVGDGINFCPKCGNQIGGVSVPTQTAPGRQQSLVEMKKMYSYFVQKQNEYNEYDQKNDRIEALLRPRSVAAMSWGIILCILGALAFILGIATKSSFIVMGILGGCTGGGLIFLHIWKQKKYNEELIQCQERVGELAQELTQHFRAYGYCPVGPEYTNPSILQQIMSVIQSGRAETPKEAINVLLDDAHKSSMEFAAMLTARNAQAAAEYAQGAAAGATASAVFSAANFFLK